MYRPCFSPRTRWQRDLDRSEQDVINSSHTGNLTANIRLFSKADPAFASHPHPGFFQTFVEDTAFLLCWWGNGETLASKDCLFWSFPSVGWLTSIALYSSHQCCPSCRVCHCPSSDTNHNFKKTWGSLEKHPRLKRSQGIVWKLEQVSSFPVSVNLDPSKRSNWINSAHLAGTTWL